MKKIEMYIEKCSQCPYFEYDSYYSMNKDSGYDCKHDKGGRIIDDFEWSNSSNPARLNQFMKDIPTPDWCPLEDVTRRDKLEKIISKMK